MQKSTFFIAFLLILCNNRLVAQAIRFQEFSINDTLITEKNKILEINGQSVNILISHFPNDTTHYQYQLEGIDREWKNYHIQSNIYYHELPGGKYAFIIRAKNSSTQQQKVFFNIRPQLWQKWWFLPSIYLFIVLIIASALYFVFLYRLRQEVQMRQVRNNIASDLHDEIGATLSGIGILSTIAQQKLLESHPSHALIGRITEDALNIG
jgi:signal transduction histidine kinase